MFRQDLSKLPLFKDFYSSQLTFMQSHLTLVQFTPHEIIFQQGQAATNLYFLIQSEVEVHYKPYDGPFLTVAHINPGGIFGWSAALRRNEYSSEVVSVYTSSAYRMPADALSSIRKLDPDMMSTFLDRLAGEIAKRIITTQNQVVKILQTVLI